MFLFLSSNSIGQGYNGKRFTFTYQPAYSMVDFVSEKFVLHQKLILGYSVSKNFSIDLHVSDSRSKLYVSNYGNIKPTFQIHDFLIGGSIFYHRKFHHSYAPLGRYYGIGLDIGQQNSLREVTVPSEYYYDEEYVYEFYDDVNRVRMILVSAYFGRNFLFKEKIFFGYGLQLGIGLEENQPLRHFGKPYINCGILF